MQSEQSAEPKPCFVLRIWPEVSRPGDVRWRGEVLHTPSGERQAFLDLGAVESFVRRWTESTGEQSLK